MIIGIVFLIVVIIGVLLVIILIIGLRIEANSRSLIVYPPIAIVPFNYSCVDRPCGEGLVCDPQLNVCKLNLDQECTFSSDCATGNYCSGTCIPKGVDPSAITGITGDNCPCDYNTHSCVNGICLSTGSCVNNIDCVTGICNNGVCGSQLSNGSVCNDNAQCSSYNCSAGICQISGVETGTIGSQCYDSCNGVLICDSGICRLP